MNTKIKNALEEALKVLADNKDMHVKAGHHALAEDVMLVMTKIEASLILNVWDYDPNQDRNRPTLGRGLDGKLYLAFNHSSDAGAFLTNLGINEFSVPLHHFGGYENAILVDLSYQNKKNFAHPKKDDCLATTETWLRAMSTWLLSNDLDMKMPEGILDTDPLDLAEAIHTYRTDK